MLSRGAFKFLSLRRPLARFLSTPSEADYADPSKDPDFLRSLEQSKGKSRELTSDDDFFWHNAPVASAVTTYSKAHGAKIGIFWKPNDENNVLKTIDVNNYGAASIGAVIAVLRQAIYERHMDKLVVYTTSEYVEKVVNKYLATWKANDYTKKDGTEVKNRQAIEELATLVEKLQVKVKRTSVTEEKSIKEALESEFTSDSFHDEVLEQQRKYGYSPSHLAEFGPIVYTAAALNEEGKFKRCGYAVKWADKEYEMLDDTRRLNMVPSTLFRSQLCAILLALETAVEQELKRVVIVTDSHAFLRWHAAAWKKDDGTHIANYHLYQQIVNHLEKVEVKFVLLPDNGEPGSDVEQVRLMAEDGLAYPTLKQAKKKDDQKDVDLD